MLFVCLFFVFFIVVDYSRMGEQLVNELLKHVRLLFETVQLVMPRKNQHTDEFVEIMWEFQQHLPPYKPREQVDFKDLRYEFFVFRTALEEELNILNIISDSARKMYIQHVLNIQNILDLKEKTM